jgi:hypothetical protein
METWTYWKTRTPYENTWSLLSQNNCRHLYKHNIHPMLNTQKIHDQLKRLRKSPPKKTGTNLKIQLNHMHNESSFTTIVLLKHQVWMRK